MAEPENFEEDLFADLYADDEEVSKPTQPAPETRSEPLIVNGNSAIQHEDLDETSHMEGGDQQMYNQVQDQDDDDIDFNLGNGNDYSAPAPREHEAHGPGIKEDGKMFIGGLNWETTDQSLKEYFSQFGEVVECTVMRDGASGRSRGFGFLTFKDARTVNIVMVKEHYLDGKIIDPKRAIPRDEQERTSKIFVGGVSQEASEQDFKEYFMQFGRVVDATLMMDKDTGRPRGFGFVTFDSEAAVEATLNTPLEILGKPIEVKKAQPRGNMREEEDNFGSRGGRNNRFRKGGSSEDRQDMSSANQQQQGVNNQMAPGGMTPQLMAQYWQRMQQYFAMMQQQMAMNSGRGMNPAMAQMAQMQQMQAMAAQQMQSANGDNGSQSPQAANGAMTAMQNMQNMQGMQGMQGMNPAMMAQMQQMQQMQAMQQMQQAAALSNNAPAAPAAATPSGPRPGFNAYDQQVFEQQKYEQNQRRRDQGFGQQGGFAPTSWEGMYDEVPQPNVGPARGGGGGGFQKGRGGAAGSGANPPTGPAPAPPVGAPTGPKNAGKPGANYRGGGRGGRGGYHPYSRG